MPSPFPGMDPYLEGIRWPGFHHDLATAVKYQLLPQLEPKYYADTATYFLLDSEEDVAIGANLYGDVGVVENGGEMLPGTQAGTATLPVKLRLALPHPMPHSRVETWDLLNRKLTGIEFFLRQTRKAQAASNTCGSGGESCAVPPTSLRLTCCAEAAAFP